MPAAAARGAAGRRPSAPRRSRARRSAARKAASTTSSHPALRSCSLPLYASTGRSTARGGRPARLAVSVLAWNALGAALVTALFLLLRDATGTTGLAAALAAVFALTPPFLFYFFQFYPEMVGALLLALIFRSLAYRTSWTARAAGILGLELLAPSVASPEVPAGLGRADGDGARPPAPRACFARALAWPSSPRRRSEPS